MGSSFFNLEKKIYIDKNDSGDNFLPMFEK